MAHLLIVDNDERIVELTVWFLRRAGHHVESALSYAAAREQLGGCAPDLMLADLDLGHESGLEELPKLATEGLLPPTLVVSGFLDRELEEQLMRVPGVLATLTKPVDLASLEQSIAHCLELARGLLPVVLAPQDLAPVPVQPPGGLTQRESEEGWVEIAPLAPDVAPTPRTSQPWNVGQALRGEPS